MDGFGGVLGWFLGRFADGLCSLVLILAIVVVSICAAIVGIRGDVLVSAIKQLRKRIRDDLAEEETLAGVESGSGNEVPVGFRRKWMMNIL